MYKLNEQIEENIKELQYVLKQMESFDRMHRREVFALVNQRVGMKDTTTG